MADKTFIISGRGPKREIDTEKPVGFEQLSITDTAKALASIPANANGAVITVEDATMRYRDDGTNPTATVGLRVFVGGTIVLNSRDSLDKFRAIRTGSSNSEINVSYYERR